MEEVGTSKFYDNDDEDDDGVNVVSDSGRLDPIIKTSKICEQLKKSFHKMARCANEVSKILDVYSGIITCFFFFSFFR